MNEKLESAYGRWESPLSAAMIFQESDDINFLRPCDNGIYFLNTVAGHPDQHAVWLLSNNEDLLQVSPAQANVRTRVHEYGGLAFAVSGTHLYYCDFADQQIKKTVLSSRQAQTEAPAVDVTAAASVAAAGGKLRYADFIIDKGFNRLIAVREDHRLQDSSNGKAEVVNALVSIDLDHGGEGDVLFEGTDFVSSPRLSPDGKTLAWLSWSHPNMPWDNTEIRIGNFDAHGSLLNIRQVASALPGSLLQPLFDAEGQLYFIADWSDWWNLYRVTLDELKGECKAEAVCEVEAEFSSAPWQLGHRNYALLDANTIIASYNRNGSWALGIIDIAKKQLREISAGYGQIENLTAHDGHCFFTAATPKTVSSIYSLDISQRAEAQITKTMSGAGAKSIEQNFISQAEPFHYASANGHQAYANFYQPSNPLTTAPSNSLPPTIVSVHGGPTSSAKSSLNLKVQYWTSRGFAVLDINHRGSTGYGRKFRHSLYGEWGNYDLQDIIFAVKHQIAAGRVDENKIAIRGGSAGGYAVMAALSFCDLFAAGTSYYGVSDLEVLAKDTHKFESRYLEQLIGPYPASKSLYRQRSPIHHIDQITTPLLLLQGLEDKIVPAQQSEAIYRELQQKAVDVRYISFAGEGHGFRKLSNQVSALNAEFDFYREVLKLD